MPNKGVCFVCGSLGGDFSLQIKALNKGAYFPFLEHHDPPKGSRLPGPDGIVDSCRVCYSFLTQQWEAYERNKTPAVKRLYWLKRSDNGHFTGAEMKLQGEYMAQVMGLQYQTGNDTGYLAISPVESRSNYSRDGYPHSAPSIPVSEDPRPKSSGVEGALDLSLPPVKQSTDKMQNSKSKHNRDTFVCFTCSSDNLNSSCKIIASVKHAEGIPYFPFLEKISPPRGAMPLSEKGVARVCEQCFFTLHHQWVSYEQAGAPPTSRNYNIRDNYVGSSQRIVKQNEKSKKSVSEICYLCGQSYPMTMVKPLYTVPSYTVPSVDNKLRMYFPFVRELRRPQGSQPLNPDGTVLVCQNCHGNLQSQWNLYESEKISLIQRRYSLLPVEGTHTSHSRNQVAVNTEKVKSPNTEENAESDVSTCITQPLNIQISKSPLPSSQTTAQGLLAIAHTLVKTEEPDSTSSQNNVSSTSNQSVNSALAARVLEHHRQLSEVKVGSNSTIPHPLQTAGALPKSVCFVCGENTLLTQAQNLCSYPTRHDTKLPNSQAAPFFPFLVNRDPAPCAEPMTDDGTVVSCSYCFYSLLNQWKMYEESKDPDDHKRWVRKYTVGEFVCFVCSRTVSRKNLRNLEVKKYSFLKDHPVPNQAIVINDGENVVVCHSCQLSLSHQLAEYERLGLPYELHKYNWIQQQPSSVDHQSRNQDDLVSDVRSKPSGLDEDSNSCMSDISKPADGSSVPQASKPPPLTMLSPAGSKVTRNTATVPPLSQVSPSNGLTSANGDAALSATRTSSFAAALRKLAHQAKDPAEEVSVKHSSPNSGVSPRATTPKRAPPPLVYTSQSSNLTSPPVVTIAPTQTHPSLHSDSRQAIERVPSAHSTASSVYESLSLKQERDQRPLSSHSRDDDRLSSKDVAMGQTSRIMTPRSTPGSIPTSREESLIRGFQPYRAGEEMRHPVPPGAFAMDPAYAYHPAFLQHHPYSHPAYRFDDPLMLERYRMMQPPMLPFSPAAGMLPHPNLHHLITSGHYPPELLRQQYPYLSPSAQQLDPRSPSLVERSRTEEERQREIDRERECEREKEREKERERERELEAEAQRMRERQREMEKEKQRLLARQSEYSRDYSHRELEKQRLVDYSRELRHSEHLRDVSHSEWNSSRHDDHAREVLTVPVLPHHDKSGSRGDDSGPNFGSITQGTPRDREYSEKYKDEYSEYKRLNNTKWTAESLRISHNDYLKNHYHHQKVIDTSQSRYYGSSAPTDLSQHYHGEPHPEAGRPQGHEERRGQPPPLLSPKSQGEANRRSSDSIFRPFEKCGQTEQLNSYQYSKSSASSRSSDLLIPTYRSHADREHATDLRDKSKEVSVEKHNHVAQKVDCVKDYSRKQEKISLNNNIGYSNHHVECFNFKSLAMQKANHRPEEKTEVSVNQAVQLYNAQFVPADSETSKIRSRLDIGEEKLHEARLNGTYCSESEDELSEEEDERRTHRCMMVTKGPPLPLEITKPKIKLFRCLGLVSQRRKRDVLYERFKKRRKFHRERSISPVEIEEERRVPVLGMSTHHPESLCHGVDYRDKCLYLRNMSLLPVGKDGQKELEHIRTVCEEEKRKRLGQIEQRGPWNGELSKSQRENNDSGGHGVKRKYEELDSSSGSSRSDQSDTPKISLSQLQERHLAARQKLSSATSHLKSSAFVFPESRDRERHLSREFVEQFHESVLQSTRQKELSERLGSSSSRSDDSSRSQEHAAVSSYPRNHSSSDTPSSSSHYPQCSDSTATKWPGIESVMESYHKYLQDQKLEKQILLERCRWLRSDNRELNKNAERLSHRMSTLLEAKQKSDEDRNISQNSLDNLKRSIKHMR